MAYHDYLAINEMQELASMGGDSIAYMRQISGAEIIKRFPGAPEELDEDMDYWALFAADGQPLVLANTREEITASAFHSDLVSVLPN